MAAAVAVPAAPVAGEERIYGIVAKPAPPDPIPTLEILARNRLRDAIITFVRSARDSDFEGHFWRGMNKWIPVKKYLNDSLHLSASESLYHAVVDAFLAHCENAGKYFFFFWWLLLKPDADNFPLKFPSVACCTRHSSTALCGRLHVLFLADEKTGLEYLSVKKMNFGSVVLSYPENDLSLALRTQTQLTALEITGFDAGQKLLHFLLRSTNHLSLKELILGVSFASPPTEGSVRALLAMHSPTLTTLDLRRGCSLPAFAKALHFCTHLNRLSVDMGFVSSCPPECPSVPSVRDLTIDRGDDPCSLSPILRVFPNLSNLQMDCCIDRDSIADLQSLSHCLTKLNCKVSGEVSLAQIFKCCPKVRSLQVGYLGHELLPWEEDEKVTSMPLLQILHLGVFDSDIHAKDLMNIIANSPNLERLQLYCQGITEFRPTDLLKMLRERKVLMFLRKLIHLSEKPNPMTTEPLVVQLLSLPEIQEIKLPFWCHLTDAEMERVLALAKEKDMEAIIAYRHSPDGWFDTQSNQFIHFD